MKVTLTLKSGRKIKLESSEVQELYNELGAMMMPWVSVPSCWEIKYDPARPSTTIEWETVTAGGTYDDGSVP